MIAKINDAYYTESATMSIEEKIKNAKPTMFGFDNIPKWKLILWVYIGKIKGRKRKAQKL